MIKILTIALIISTLLFQSCENNQNTSTDTNVTIEKINELEKELFNSGINTIDTKKARELCGLYMDYADLYPNDSISPELLYKAADINMNVNDPKSTIVLFNKIRSTYPNYKNVPTILFLTGYVYENQLHDFENAKKYYLELLDIYPNNEFADDAVISINNLGKTPEEMIEGFKNK